MIFLEFADQPFDDTFVPVIATEMGVACCGFDLDNAIANFQDRDIESAATQVEDQDSFVTFLVHAVSEGRGSGFVDDAQNFESSNFAGVFGGLALAVVEVSGNRDHRLGDRLTEIGFGVFFEFAQDHGADLLRCVRFTLNWRFHTGITL